MDLRFAALIAFGVFGVAAWHFELAPEGYTLPWLLIGVLALGWVAVVALRNRRTGNGKHYRKED